MKFFPFLLLIISFSLNTCVHDDNLIDSFPIENDIMILTDTTFEKAITKYENVFVAFYAPWCGHCQKLLPELEKVAEILSKENIIVAKVDATKEKNLSNKYKIVSYPTLRFFKENTSVKYSGKRKQNDLIEWARKMSAPPVVYLKSLENIETIKNENNVSVIYFGKEEKHIKIFKTLSVKFIDIPFAIVEDEKIAQLYKAVPKSVVVLKKFDEKRKDIINFDEKKLENFIKKNSEPKIFSFNDKNINLIFNKNKPAFVYFGRKGDLKWKKDTSTIEKLAYNVENDLIFIMTEINDGYGKNIAERIKLRNSEIPCIMILDVKINIDRYKYEGNYEYNDLLNFIENWEKGLIKKYLRSEKAPKHNKGNVFILVGDTFKREVIENDDDVMVLFYNPVNNDNMIMLRLYDEVADNLVAFNPDLILAKIDMSENEIDSFVIHEFPTIKFFPGNRKYSSPFEYKGPKNAKDLISFIKKHAFHPVKSEEDINSDL